MRQEGAVCPSQSTSIRSKPMRLSGSDLELLLHVARDASLGASFQARMEAITASVAELIPGAMFTFIVLDPAQPEAGIDAYVQNADPRGAQVYAERYVAFDPMPARLLERPRHCLRLSDTVDPGAWGKDAYTGEFLPGEGIAHILGFVSPLSDGRLLQTGIHRDHGPGDFTDGERRLLSLASEDISRAARSSLLQGAFGRPRAAPVGGPRLGLLLLGSRDEIEFEDEATRQFVEDLRPDFPLDAVFASAHAARASHPTPQARAVVAGELVLHLTASALEAGGTGSVLVVLERRSLVGWRDLAERLAPFGVTAREREVARQAALGLTNPQIAGILKVRRPTVAAHLSSVFRKTGVNGRTELARLLAGPPAGST